MPSTPIEIPAGYGLCTVLLSITGRTKFYSVAFGYNAGAAVEDNNTGALLSALQDGTGLFAHARMSTQYAVEGIRTRQQSDTDEFSYDDLTRTQGTQSLLPPPANTCVLVRKNSVLSGKKNRGRFYLPPFNITQTDVDVNGDIATAALAEPQTGANTTLAALATADLPMVILHHGTGVPTPVASLTVEGTVATQRRRIR